MNNDRPTPAPATPYVMRLFVTGNAPNSRIARENLAHFQACYPEYIFEIEIIDLFTHPELALIYGVYIAPALQILNPAPGGIIYGNLSDHKVLDRLLQTVV